MSATTDKRKRKSLGGILYAFRDWRRALAKPKDSPGRRKKTSSVSAAVRPRADAPIQPDVGDERVVVIEYIKSSYFRVVHSTGAIGGITPEGNIHMAFFSERPAIPRMQVHKLQP